MRWFWLDRFVEFRRGRRAVAIKNVTASEEQLIDNFVGYPVMPATLIIEGLAQTGGILVSEFHAFRQRVVLAKVGKAVFHDHATPGDTLRYTAEVEDIKPDGAICRGACHVVNYGASERLLAEIELVFAHLDDERFAGVEMFGPGELLRVLSVTGVFEVGVDDSGRPIGPPPHLAADEPADG